VVPVPDRPYFFLPTLLFFQRDWPCDPIFSGWLRAAAKMASVVSNCWKNTNTNCWKNHEKNIQKKIISDLPTLIFLRYETGTTGIFLRLMIPSHTLHHLTKTYDTNSHGYSLRNVNQIDVRKIRSSGQKVEHFNIYSRYRY
jgi:hypothetical protein